MSQKNEYKKNLCVEDLRLEKLMIFNLGMAIQVSNQATTLALAKKS